MNELMKTIARGFFLMGMLFGFGVDYLIQEQWIWLGVSLVGLVGAAGWTGTAVKDLQERFANIDTAVENMKRILDR